MFSDAASVRTVSAFSYCSRNVMEESFPIHMILFMCVLIAYWLVLFDTSN